MKLFLKKLATSLALVAACGSTFAADLTATGSGNQTFSAGVVGGDWTFEHTAIKGKFLDTITFNLPSLSDYSYFANTYYLKGKTDIINFAGWLDGNALAITSTGKFETAGADLQLASGVHTLSFSGHGVESKGGSYSVWMSASPVPEPESYAMLLKIK